VPGVPVQVKNVATNEVASSVTDPQGTFTVPFLRPGNYSITVEASGFKRYVREGLTLNVGQIAGINITLEIGASSEQITVTAETPLLETETANRGQIVDEQRVREFPLNARNPFMLSMLSAGVNFNGNIIYQRPFDNGAIADWTINGGWNRNNEFLLDGAPNNAQAGGNNIALVPPVDSVQEFKIQTNSYDAQYGKTSGGIINVNLKSGTNTLHGTLYEFARRNPWDANSFQNNAQGIPRIDHFLDQYGGALGGPIIFPKLYNGKDRSFFFFNYEGYREGTPTPLNLSVPEPEFINGDFSKLVDNQGRQIVIYDPTSGRDVNGTWTRTPFDRNKIPGDKINMIAQKILSYFPKPNRPFQGSFYSQSNLFLPGGENLDHDAFYNLVIKFDQNFGDKNHVFFRHASNDRTEIRPTNGVKGPGADGQLPLKRVNDAYVVDWVRTVTATLIGNARFSFARYIEGSRGDPDNGFSPTQLGFPASLINQTVLPNWFGRYEFDNYQSLGRYFGFNYTNTLAFHPTITKIYHQHDIKGGVDMRWIQYNQENVGNPFRLQGTRAFTQKEYNRGDALSGNSIASFLLGTPGGGSADYNVFPSTTQAYIAPWVQDDWKVTRKLTVNIGLRWDFNGPPSERHNRLNRSFDPNSVSPADKLVDHSKFPALPTLKGQLLFAGVNGAPTLASNLDWTAIQPRVGFAYQLRNKLVIRGGWGKYYFNPSNDYIQTNGFSQGTSFINSLDGGRTAIPNLINNPFPQGISVPPGSSLGALTFLGRGLTYFDPNFKVPYVNQFSFGFQYELPNKSTVEASYVGNRSYKLQSNFGYNEPNLAFRQQCNPLEGGNPAFCDFLVSNPFYQLAPFTGTGRFTDPTVSRFELARPFPEFGGITQDGRNDGKLWYNSLQVTYQIRAKGGVTMSAAYTLSKQVEQWGFNDNQKFVLQRGLYTDDRPHTVVVGSVWELPFGKGRHFFNSSSRLWSRIASGWQHTMIFTYSSGMPWNLPSGVDYVREAKNPNIDWSAPLIQGVRPCVARFNSDNTISLQPFSATLAGCTLDNYNFLILPRYAPRETTFRDGRLRLHSTPQFQMSVNKNTQITEHTSLQFRAEAFNVFNTFYFPQAQFNNDPNSSNFGTITKATVGQGSANFPRQIQLAVKFIF